MPPTPLLNSLPPTKKFLKKRRKKSFLILLFADFIKGAKENHIQKFPQNPLFKVLSGGGDERDRRLWRKQGARGVQIFAFA